MILYYGSPLQLIHWGNPFVAISGLSEGIRES